MGYLHHPHAAARHCRIIGTADACLSCWPSRCSCRCLLHAAHSCLPLLGLLLCWLRRQLQRLWQLLIPEWLLCTHPERQPAGAAGTGSKPLRPRVWLRCCCQGPGAALAGSTHPHIRSHGSKKQQRQRQARRAQPEVLVRSAAAPRRQPLPPGGLSQAAPPPLQGGILTRARGWPKSPEWAALAAQGHALAGAQSWTTHLCCEGATPIPDS